MIRSTTTYLWLILLFSFWIQQGQPVTHVIYEFHIREAGSEREEKGELESNSSDSRAEPELKITGKRYGSSVILGKNPEKDNNYIFVENATYFADDSGYHVKYNYTIERVPDLDSRLNGQTLKSTIG
ncbi:hypothetical protein KR026_005332 [Drosophila bipectinata]|nr:hypothetical protein KR026_005332 [Drosophila bipectinata]